MISRHLMLLMLLSALFSGEGISILKPQSTNVIVNKLITFKCSTSYSNYSLLFSYETPPGYNVNNLDSPGPEALPGGGTVITTTFLVTKYLNTTNVTCLALAAGANHNETATITAYDVVPNGLNNIKVCQLDHFVFVSWDKSFTPKGINVTYSINDNRGLQTVINNSRYSFFLNETSEINYDVNITAVVIAMAANQTDNTSITTLQRKLNGTVRLDLSYDEDNSYRVGGDEWILLFKVQLHHLHPDQCIIDNETLKGASVMNCWSNNNCTNSTSVQYDKHNNEINSTNRLAAREKYNSTLCFNHLGINIMSQPVRTSTHDIQDIEDISPNDTSLCLRFHLIHHAQSQEFHLHLRRDNKISERYNVTLPDLQNNEWCASTIPATSSNNNGNWSLYAYDAPEYTNPAVVLENIVLNITETSVKTINRATTHNTIATYTTHTTNTYLSYSSTFVSYSSPSPSSTETATLPSSTVNLIAIVSVSVFATVLFINVVIIVVIILIKNRKGEVTTFLFKNHKKTKKSGAYD